MKLTRYRRSLIVAFLAILIVGGSARHEYTLPLAPEVASKPEPTVAEVRKQEEADRINAYFQKRDMPLAGYGLKFVEEAGKNGIDWRLVAAISVKESSGGKHRCGYNAFGWASCKRTFNSFNEAIEEVSAHLGGNRKSTASYYGGKTSEEKLYYYNGTVEAGYPARVMAIMEKF